MADRRDRFPTIDCDCACLAVVRHSERRRDPETDTDIDTDPLLCNEHVKLMNPMKTKVSVFIATSLDGFIARPDGDIDWLDRFDSPPNEDYGFRKFFDSIDVLVMGRNTFEKVLTFDTWPYGNRKVVVMSSGSPAIPDSLSDHVFVSSASPEELVEELSGQKPVHIYVDGGKTIQRFLAAGLLDELIITRLPVLIGDGIPLFGPLDADIELEHIETRQFGNGLEQSRYRVKESEQIDN